LKRKLAKPIYFFGIWHFTFGVCKLFATYLNTNSTHMSNFSRLIMGTMRLGLWGVNCSTSQWQEFIENCLELGVTTFDHADIYGDYTTEADFGKVLKAQPGLRSQLQIITKCGIRRVCEQRPDHRIKSYDSSKAHIIWSAENSLKELHTDSIDLLLLHRPDWLMQPDEVAEAFRQLQEAGKVKAFGVSNFTPAQFDLLNDRFPLTTNQVEISILHRNSFEDGTLDQCLKHRIHPQAWSPMGGGAIFKEQDNTQVSRIQQVIQSLSEKYNASPDQILLAWLLRHPVGIQPVLGTTKMERVRTAVKALDIQLTQTEWYDLWQAATGAKIA